jgi:hypothetical protein
VDSFLEDKTGKGAGINKIGFIVGAVIGIALLGLVVWLLMGPSRQEQIANVLEGSYHEGTPEFEQITKDIIISTREDTVESPNAFGTISMFIKGRIRNKGTSTINGLEVSVAVVDRSNQVVKEKRVLVIPAQYDQLGPGETIDPVTLAIDGFNRKDDRANIRWKVTAIRTAQ